MEVFLLAKPGINWDGFEAWITQQGGETWLNRILADADLDPNSVNDGQVVAEAAGRRCYRSWEAGLNANVTKVREDSTDYLQNIVTVGHGSVYEHGMWTFALEGISRVVTHELVRHRVGVAISQESLRYVRLTNIPFRLPDWIANDDILNPLALDLVQRMEEFQLIAADQGGLDDEGRDFHYKKMATSDMRRFAPIGLLTGMVWSANLRTLRQVIEARTDAGAEREIRDLFNRVGEIMLADAPAVFADFERVPVDGSDVPAWVPKRSKI